MAHTNPTTWASGDIVTSSQLNCDIRDNLLHVAGSCGFNGTMSATRGVEPVAGYFAGANAANYHIEGRTTSVSSSTTRNFTHQFTSAPAVIITPFSTRDATFSQWSVAITAVTSSGFTCNTTGKTVTFNFLAFGPTSTS